MRLRSPVPRPRWPVTVAVVLGLVLTGCAGEDAGDDASTDARSRRRRWPPTSSSSGATRCWNAWRSASRTPVTPRSSSRACTSGCPASRVAGRWPRTRRSGPDWRSTCRGPTATSAAASDDAPRVGRPVVTLRVTTASDPDPRGSGCSPARDEGWCSGSPTGPAPSSGSGGRSTCGSPTPGGQRRRRTAWSCTERCKRGCWATSPGPSPRWRARSCTACASTPRPARWPTRWRCSAPTGRRREIPVEAYAARCDPHTIGEIKKPYEFLVWVGAPGEEAFAVTPEVGQATKDALRLACAF